MRKARSPDHSTVASNVEVTKYQREELNPADESGMTVVETRLEEQFTGGMIGQGIATHLRIERADGTGNLICYERFTGTVDGADGSFLLQASGFTDRHQYVHGQWEIVEGSGTGALSGIRGYAAFAASRAAGTRTGWKAETSLTYWFEA